MVSAGTTATGAPVKGLRIIILSSSCPPGMSKRCRICLFHSLLGSGRDEPSGSRKSCLAKVNGRWLGSGSRIMFDTTAGRSGLDKKRTIQPLTPSRRPT